MSIKNKDGLSEKEFLDQYNPGDYEKPSITVDILIFSLLDKYKDLSRQTEKELKLLLIERKDHPFIHCWAIPGGFVEMDENLDHAAYRELKEETNVRDVYLEQLYTFSKIDRDPRMRVISTAYLALTSDANISVKAGDDAKDAKWFIVQLENDILKLTSEDGSVMIVYDMNTLMPLANSEKLAFDHIEEIKMALERLRNKVEYTDIAFSLLPKEFMFRELQEVYEVLLGRSIDDGNFRRDNKHRIMETGNHISVGPKKSKTKLYKKKEIK